MAGLTLIEMILAGTNAATMIAFAVCLYKHKPVARLKSRKMLKRMRVGKL